MTVFKIMDPARGKFSNGSAYPRFVPIGRVWNSITAVKLHLNTVSSYRDPYKNAVVVEYEVTEKSRVKVQDV